MMSIPSELNSENFEERKEETIIRCPSKWSEIVRKDAPPPTLPISLASLPVKQKNKETRQPVKQTKPKPPTLAEIVKDRNKVLILLRGLPGCGKTSFAKFLKSQSTQDNQIAIYSVNSFFEQKDGQYIFDGRRVRDSKKKAYSSVTSMMKESTPVIIVDDYHVTISDVKPYIEDAESHDYNVEIVEVKTPWCMNVEELEKRCITNGHSVSKDVIESMKRRWFDDMTVDNAKMIIKKMSTHTKQMKNNRK